MIAVTNTLLEKLDSELKDILDQGEPILPHSEKCINAIVQIITELRQSINKKSFKTKEEEIRFFKHTKPKFTSRLIYYSNVLKIESRRPIGSYETQINYFKEKLEDLKNFFQDNSDFYQYYRLGCTHLDEKYFLRNSFDIRLQPDPQVFNHDPQFSTSHDYKVAMLLANEMLSNYLNSMLIELEEQKYSNNINTNRPKLLWTAPKAALIELAYGLHAAGVFNNSNADVKQIAGFFESLFNIDLGNYYRTFLEIRTRKSGRTNFIDQMKKKLVERMEQIDDDSMGR